MSNRKRAKPEISVLQDSTDSSQYRSVWLDANGLSAETDANALLLSGAKHPPNDSNATLLNSESGGDVATLAVGTEVAIVQQSAAPGSKRTESGSDVAVQAGGAVVASAKHPASPSNRDKFMMKQIVQSIGCNLESINVSPAVRLSFRGTVAVLYPPQMNPDRRYVIFLDESGWSGITIWSPHVKEFNAGKVGRLVEITKMALSVHKGQKSLSMTKESSVVFMESSNVWWSGLLFAPVMSLIDVHSLPENSVVRASGVVGFMCSEEKVVRNAPVQLLIIRIVDRTGEIEVRSWTRKLADFSRFREKPILISRGRVTAYAGVKMIELIDGESGSVVTDDFDQASELLDFWNSPAD